MNPFQIICNVVIAAVSGATAVPLVLRLLKDRWIEKLKAGYADDLEFLKDQLLRQQKQIDAQLLHQTSVTRSQFEVEFSAMQKIYASATLVSQAIGQLRPIVDQLPADNEEKKILFQQRWVDLVQAFNPFSTEIDALSPFYPLDLYEELLKCRKAAAKEIIQIRGNFDDAFGFHGYAQAE